MRQQFDTTAPQSTSGEFRVPIAEGTHLSHTTVEQRVAPFLAAMRGSLSGMSEVEAQAVLDEMRQHVLASARAFEELGDAPAVALQNALAAFGSPQALGSELTETYQVTGTARQAFPTAALCRSLRVFSAAMVLAVGMMLFSVFLHQLAPAWGQSPLGVFYNYHVAWVITLLVPAIAGWNLGRSKLPRAGLGAFYALALLALGTAPLMLPSVISEAYAPWRDVLLLTPVFFVFWIPTATLAAQVSSLVARRRTALLCRAH